MISESALFPLYPQGLELGACLEHAGYRSHCPTTYVAVLSSIAFPEFELFRLYANVLKARSRCAFCHMHAGSS